MITTSRRRAGTAAAVLSAAALVVAGCSGSSEGATTEQGFPETITLAAIPAENSTDLKASYDPVIERLENETGATVDFVQASDYAGVVEGLIAGNVDIAFFGPFAYVVAGINGADMTPLGAVVQDEASPPGYQSYGIARSDNASVNGLADYAGKKVCFVDPSSTSGFLYPTAGLIEDDVITSGSEADISAAMTPIYAGGHDASALGVKAGDCDAGFAFDTMVDRTMIDNGELAPGELKTVWKSEMIAGSLFAANNDLGSEAIAKLQDVFSEGMNSDAFIADGICAEECRITDEDAWGVVPAQDSDYDGVRHVCEVTGSEKCQG
ncbi:phosphate/phosphite/phosphonate ABC transporter substrate-binding protein [Rhodococcus sp. 05-340-1]|uniref:phosphate/phosphite/phosphonate ABC transporter substrate-binding protein n=1 Tax=Nocardiaceae TaxID=85025 RepID=UPI0005673495|nr:MULTISPECIES: phosphate/phosphite/phosphonate ABC transporter substrate-binding protein [Rhodococcus]OZD71178.1 phosphate/phosphite/phosphonate ABC transporter substrate-binding protein [Rhodococcus sp. 05-340-2]OZD74015.1 phosphate/phosphite/phosphonate ABC transporter substrate-binding protein [Rhodococcus sp. 05-340-1]OZE99713.1 phosphate/phosphite/phosphonate ABC transporter substrate-binding protein [Rhodococcus sp. 15-2388-1-1a]OZF37022.1 phosphate/phosphite/phosphonate ABC transporter